MVNVIRQWTTIVTIPTTIIGANASRSHWRRDWNDGFQERRDYRGADWRY